MPTVDVVLDAENEVTPEFGFKQLAPGIHIPHAEGYVHAIRNSGSTQITLAVEYAVPGSDGTKTWHQDDTFNVPAAAGSTAMHHLDDLVPGMVARVRYDSAETDEIRVIVSRPD